MKLFLKNRLLILINLPTKLIAQQNTLHELGKIVRLEYNNPGLIVDLEVGLWALPMPMDFNDDGKTDLLIDAENGYLYYLINE